MRRNACFWRNVTLIALVHVAGVITLLRWASGSKIASAQEITWLSSATEDASADDAVEYVKETATPEPTRKPTPTEETQPVSTPAKSEIQIPAATPHPTPRPSPSATVTPKPLPRPSPKSSPKKKSSPKPSATPEEKKPQAIPASAKKKETAKKATEKKDKTASSKSENKPGDKSGKAGNVAGGHASGAAGAPNAGWYGNMLHDRFYREWAQPTTVVASGAKLSALVKIRIEKDGRISDFKIVRPSGNVVVDESIEAVAKKVTRVDALPAELGNGEHYDVNVNFELSSK